MLSYEWELLLTYNDNIINFDILIDSCELTPKEQKEIFELFSLDWWYEQLFSYVHERKPEIGEQHNSIMSNENLANIIGEYAFIQ